MAQKLRAVFMGTPDFAVPSLRALASVVEVVGVFTQPDRPVGRGLELQASPVKKVARELGFPVYQPEKLSKPEAFLELKKLSPEIIVVVAFGQILKQEVLELPRLGCINVHSSLLPRWRGAAPIHWALLSGDTETGVTTMCLVEKLDAGDVLLQATTKITESDTLETLHDRLAEMGASLIGPTVEGLALGQIKPVKQDEAFVTYASKLTKEMELLDPKLPAEKLERRVKALNPWPGTSVLVELEPGVPLRLKIKQARLRRDISGKVGEIFERSGMVLLGCAEGALELEGLQWDGKKLQNPSDFLNGLRGRGKTLPLALRTASS